MTMLNYTADKSHQIISYKYDTVNIKEMHEKQFYSNLIIRSKEKADIHERIYIDNWIYYTIIRNYYVYYILESILKLYIRHYY